MRTVLRTPESTWLTVVAAAPRGDHSRPQPFDLPLAYLRPVERRRIRDGLVCEDSDRAVEFPAHTAVPGRVKAVEINCGGVLLLVAARHQLVRAWLCHRLSIPLLSRERQPGFR